MFFVSKSYFQASSHPLPDSLGSDLPPLFLLLPLLDLGSISNVQPGWSVRAQVEVPVSTQSPCFPASWHKSQRGPPPAPLLPPPGTLLSPHLPGLERARQAPLCCAPAVPPQLLLPDVLGSLPRGLLRGHSQSQPGLLPQCYILLSCFMFLSTCNYFIYIFSLTKM